MATAQAKQMMKGVTLRKGATTSSVRYAIMLNGRRYTKTSDIPVSLLIDAKGRPTSVLRQDYAKFLDECERSSGTGAPIGMHEPTIREIITAYKDLAGRRVANPTYRLGERAVQSTLMGFGRCVEESGLEEGAKFSRLTDPDMQQQIFDTLVTEKKLSGVTAKSYLMTLKSVTAHWTLLEYRKLGYDVRPPVLIDFGTAGRAPQYKRLPEAKVRQIEQWYLHLAENAKSDVYLMATMAYQLAVRPIDCEYITRENFVLQPNGHMRIVYIPHKTADSTKTNRRVDIEIPDILWEQIYQMAGKRLDAGEVLIPNRRYIEVLANASMRTACGMPAEEWPKAVYELRKLCIDTTAKTRGIDAAVKISGDRRDTIEQYYMDPYRSEEPAQLIAPLGTLQTEEEAD